MSKFPCSLTRNMTSHSMENLTFHSLLRWKMIIIQILATPLMHFLFKRLGECTFWGVKGLIGYLSLTTCHQRDFVSRLIKNQGIRDAWTWFFIPEWINERTNKQTKDQYHVCTCVLVFRMHRDFSYWLTLPITMTNKYWKFHYLQTFTQLPFG